MKSNKCTRVYADIDQINDCKNRLETVGPAIGLLAKVLNLAGNEVRLKILFILHEKGKQCVCDLSDILNISIPAVSQHLKKMKDGKVLCSEKIGQTIFYEVREEFGQLFKPNFLWITAQPSDVNS